MNELSKKQVKAIRENLQIDKEIEIEVHPFADDTYRIDGREYLVLTNDEADEMATTYIKDSLWAFNHNFLYNYGSVISEIPEKSYEKMQGELCESFNDAVLAMIGDDLEALISDAIRTDGRGHFMNSYDGEEIEVCVAGKKNEYIYLYRVN